MTFLFSPGCHMPAGNKHLAKVGSPRAAQRLLRQGPLPQPLATHRAPPATGQVDLPSSQMLEPPIHQPWAAISHNSSCGLGPETVSYRLRMSTGHSHEQR